MGYLNIRHLIGHGHQVVGHGAIQKIAIIAVNALLIEHRADALNDTTADLLVHQKRIDNAAAVIDGPLAEHFNKARLAIDFDVAPLYAIRHIVELIIRGLAASDRQLHVEIGRKRILSEVADATDLGQADDGLSALRSDHVAGDDVEGLGWRLRDRAGERQDVAFEQRAGLECRLASNGCAARGPGAAAISRNRAVAPHHGDVGGGNADAVSHDLGDCSQCALPLIREAGDAANSTRRFEPKRAAVLGRDRSARGAIVRRPIGGLLDEGGDPDAAENALGAQALLFFSQALVVHQSNQLLQAFVKRDSLEPLSARRHARQGSLRPIIAPLELHRVDAERARCKVGQQLGDDARERHPDATVHADEILVDVDTAGARLVIPEAVGCTGDRDGHHAFRDVEPHRHAIGTHRAHVVYFHSGDLAGLLQRDARRDAVIACMSIGEKRFEPVDGKLDGPPEQHAGHHGGDFVGIEVELHSESAADVRRDHSHLVLRYLQMPAEYLLHLERRLVRVDHRQRALRGVKVGDQAAAFERHRKLALEPELFGDHKIGLGKRLRGLALLQCVIERNIVPEFRVDRYTRAEGLLVVGRRRQFLPFDGDELGCVLRLGPALGNHRHDRLPLPHRALLDQERLRRRAVPGAMQGNADKRIAQRIEITRGKDRRYAWRLSCRFGVDPAQPGMGMRAAHEADVQHARQLDVVEITAMAAQQPLQFPPRHAGADRLVAFQAAVAARHYVLRVDF